MDIDRAKWLLRLSLNALALPASDQLALEGKVYESVAVDLFEDFGVAEKTIRPFAKALTGPQRKAISAVQSALGSLAKDDFEDQTPARMSRPGWQPVRKSAARALAAFKWPLVPPRRVGEAVEAPQIEPEI